MNAKNIQRQVAGIDPAFIEQVREAAHILADADELPNYYGVSLKLGATERNAVAIDTHLIYRLDCAHGAR